MDHFHYRNGELHAESVRVADIATAAGTPCYVYSAATFGDHYDRLAAAFAPLEPLICYSVKSCPNVHICRLLAQRGGGFDVVSGGELHRALAAGGDPARIVFAGVGKTDDEILSGLDAGIGWFNVESEQELENLQRLCESRGRSARAALRVNPDVDPRTHLYTTTGTKETKFGVDIERARRVFDAYGRHRLVRPCGLHLHIGSPVNSVEPYVGAIRRGLALIDELRGAGFEIDTLDIGGGFGAHYRHTEAPLAAEYAEAIVPLLRGRGLRVILEPGRSIAANAGILVTRVLYLKSSGERTFVICDAGMNDLIRPALYEAYHFVWPVRPPPGFVTDDRGEQMVIDGTQVVDVVGPVCESGDFLALNRPMPPLRRGDLLAVFAAGAYGMSMASNYNSRPRPPEVLVGGARFRTIRRRETYADLVTPEMSADGQGGG